LLQIESLGKSKHLVLVSLKVGEDTQWFSGLALCNQLYGATHSGIVANRVVALTAQNMWQSTSVWQKSVVLNGSWMEVGV